MKKRLILIATAATLAAATFTASVSAASVHSFTDVGGIYEEPVSFLYEREVISGINSARYGTNETVTRGDAVVILARSFGITEENADFPDAGFKDVNSRIQMSVNALAAMGVISGVSKTQFLPNEPLTRGAMAKLLVNMFGFHGDFAKSPFTDASGAFEPYINTLYRTKITSGKTATLYGTNDPITRGEFAVFLYNTYNYIWNSYEPEVTGGHALSSSSIQLEYGEALPEDISGEELLEFLEITFAENGGEEEYIFPTSVIISEDRTSSIIKHENNDLTGSHGSIFIEDVWGKTELPYDYR